MIAHNVSRVTFAHAMREDRGRFAALSGARVFMYWPHGLGDWATLGAVVPMLEPSNTYAIARFGDDYSALFEGCAVIVPYDSGVRPPSEGSELGTPHLGLALRRLRGGRAEASVPQPLLGAVQAFAPDALLWTDYPETEGRTPFPFHTKARNLARLLVRPQRLSSFDLSRPLRNAIDFAAPLQTQRRVDERLAVFAPGGTRLCVLSRTGFTAARKNWGDGAEARLFIETLLRDDPAWRVISMDDEARGNNVAGFRQLFGDLDEPFARVYKALAARTNVFVGVPAGPLHVTMARGGVPIVGVWLAHHPDWYDEPNDLAVHLVGRFVRDRGFHRRAATTTKPASLRHEIRYLDTVEVSPNDVMEAIRSLVP